jgi:hypothetical protein
MQGRDFIEMMRPLLGIVQKNIVSLSITARHDDAVRMEIECIGKEAAYLNVIEITTDENKPEVRQFMVYVTEVQI